HLWRRLGRRGGQGRHAGGPELEATGRPPARRRRHDGVHAEDVGEPAAREAVGLGALRLRHEAVHVRGSARDVPDAYADTHALLIARRRRYMEARVYLEAVQVTPLTFAPLALLAPSPLPP